VPNIIVIVDTYNPDKTSGAKLISDILKELTKKNKVILICPREHFLPNSNKKNLSIYNIYCGPIKSQNFLIRGFFEIFMSIVIWFCTKKYIKEFKPDLLICYSPSIFFNYFCKNLLKTAKCKSYLILRDIFPFWIFDIKKIDNFILKFFLINYFKTFCNNFDKIGVEAKKNIIFLRKIGIKKKVEHLPNWISTKDFQARKKLNRSSYSFIFCGNIGIGQDITKLNNFINIIKNYSFIKFFVCGEGHDKHLLNIDHNLNNLKLEKAIRYKKLLMKMKHINFGIISLKEEIKTVNFPGKILTYLLTNTPILILSNKKNELTEFVETKKIGIRMADSDDFENILKKLIQIEKRVKKNNLDFKKILNKFFSITIAKKKILNDLS